MGDVCGGGCSGTSVGQASVTHEKLLSHSRRPLQAWESRWIWPSTECAGNGRTISRRWLLLPNSRAVVQYANVWVGPSMRDTIAAIKRLAWQILKRECSVFKGQRRPQN